MAKKIIFSFMSGVAFLYLSIYAIDSIGMLELNSIDRSGYLNKISTIFGGDIYFSRVYIVMIFTSFSMFFGFSFVYSIFSSIGPQSILTNAASSIGISVLFLMILVVFGGVGKILFNEINTSVATGFGVSFILFFSTILYLLRRKRKGSSRVPG